MTHVRNNNNNKINKNHMLVFQRQQNNRWLLFRSVELSEGWKISIWKKLDHQFHAFDGYPRKLKAPRISVDSRFFFYFLIKNILSCVCDEVTLDTLLQVKIWFQNHRYKCKRQAKEKAMAEQNAQNQVSHRFFSIYRFVKCKKSNKIWRLKSGMDISLLDACPVSKSLTHSDREVLRVRAQENKNQIFACYRWNHEESRRSNLFR